MITQKLQECRVELQKKQLKKSGKNKFAGFEYFELKDFLPTINEMFAGKKMFSNFSMNGEIAILSIIDTEDGTAVEFTSPIAELELKGCNAIQALGGTHTYLKRYLYLNALEIVECDLFDATSGQQSETSAEEHIAKINKCKTLTALVKYFNENQKEFNGNQEIMNALSKRKQELKEAKSENS